MKKLVACLVALGMLIPTVLGLAACGETDGEHTSHTDTNSDGICDECGETLGNFSEDEGYTGTDPISGTWSYTTSAADAMALPSVIYSYQYMGSANLDTVAEVKLNADGTYELAKKITSPLRKVDIIYTFRGTYTRDGAEVTLSAAMEATQYEDWGYVQMGVKRESTSADKPSLLNFFPSSYLSTFMENKEQKVTLVGEGVCTFLMDTCAHSAHDEDTNLCPNCGLYVPHDVRDGECTKCELETVYEYYAVPDAYKTPVATDKQGRVEAIEYTTKAYRQSETPEVATRLLVYTPWDYDETKQYDVLYLCHGSGDDEKYWFEGTKGSLGSDGTKAVYTREILDNLYLNGEIGGTIVVTPDINTNSGANMAKELRNDIIPLIETRYSTYANCLGKDTVTEAEMIASREHRAMAGLSMGSSTTWQGGVMNSIDIISYFGCFHGSGGTEAAITEAITNTFGEYTLKYLYNGNGTWDNVAHDGHVQLYKALVAAGTITPGVNTCFVEKPNKAHWYSGWVIDFYNCMKNDFFKH